MSNYKKINILQLTALALTALAYSPKGEEEEKAQEWADATIGSLSQEIFDQLYENELIDEKGAPTPSGMKLLLNGLSHTPDFGRLANGDFSVAAKMLFTGQEALANKVKQNPGGQVVPKKNADGSWADTRMVTSLLAIGDWINSVTTEYRTSITTTTKKPAVKAAKA